MVNSKIFHALIFFIIDTKQVIEYAYNLSGGTLSDFEFYSSNLDMTFLCIPARAKFKFSSQVALLAGWLVHTLLPKNCLDVQLAEQFCNRWVS